eukprot:scaffold111874_cov39-Attheya_sp.AAC.1
MMWDVGEVVAALYLLLCGDKIRKESAADLKDLFCGPCRLIGWFAQGTKAHFSDGGRSWYGRSE